GAAAEAGDEVVAEEPRGEVLGREGRVARAAGEDRRDLVLREGGEVGVVAVGQGPAAHRALAAAERGVDDDELRAAEGLEEPGDVVEPEAPRLAPGARLRFVEDELRAAVGAPRAVAREVDDHRVALARAAEVLADVLLEGG